jgi:hypothetical protein
LLLALLAAQQVGYSHLARSAWCAPALRQALVQLEYLHLQAVQCRCNSPPAPQRRDLYRWIDSALVRDLYFTRVAIQFGCFCSSRSISRCLASAVQLAVGAWNSTL